LSSEERLLEYFTPKGVKCEERDLPVDALADEDSFILFDEDFSVLPPVVFSFALFTVSATLFFKHFAPMF
jgi:hypothetical protein